MPDLNQPPNGRFTPPPSGFCQLQTRQESHRNLSHVPSTHQTSAFHAHVVGADIEAGSPVSDALGLLHVEAVAGGSAGQLALFVSTDCNTEAEQRNMTALLQILCLCTTLARCPGWLRELPPCGRLARRRRRRVMNVLPYGQESRLYNTQLSYAEGVIIYFPLGCSVVQFTACCSVPWGTYPEVETKGRRRLDLWEELNWQGGERFGARENASRLEIKVHQWRKTDREKQTEKNEAEELMCKV